MGAEARLASAFAAMVVAAWAPGGNADVLQGAGITQRPGEALALERPFWDEDGRRVRLGDYFGARPVILALVYYHCPNLCGAVLNQLVETLLEGPYEPYELVALSVDPSESPRQALEKKAFYWNRYRRAGAQPHWHFLTGEQEAVAAVAASAGFAYARDAKSGQYSHPAGFLVATPRGLGSRYFLDLAYPGTALAQALAQARAGQTAKAENQPLLRCFRYDVRQSPYGPLVLSLMKGGGVAMVLALAALIWRLSRRGGGPS